MFAIRPRIFHKGLILLFVPLLFEVVVAASLIYLQHLYGESVKVEALRKQFVFHINEFWFYYTNMTTTNLGRAFIKDYPVSFERAHKALEEYRLLKAMVADDPQQQQRLADIETCFQRSRALTRELKPISGDSIGQLARILALKSNLNTCKHLLAANIEGGDLIRSFRQHELRQSAGAAERVRTVARLIDLVLVGAIVGSALIASLLFRYFMRGIHKGVRTLLLNIRRFKNGEPLVPAIGGTDEIALLDKRFHEMAEEVTSAQKMKQSFVSTMSTEFRVPISATRDYLVKLSEGSDRALPERARTRARTTEQSLQRLIGLMNDLLTVQAPGASRVDIRPRTCSFDEIIRSSIDAVFAYAERSGVRLEVQSGQVEVYADPDRIVQVLVNLLSNAIKFSPAGSTVAISTEAADDQVEVRVVDKGRGVPLHLREAIFERFRQVTATDATEKGGTGLGLPICKEIVELHGGSIGVESEEGQGSTFWFRLPARPAAGPVQAPVAGTSPAATPKVHVRRMVPKTIYAKGLILICVPLLVELAFGVSMFVLQRYYAEKLAKERAAVEIIFHANEMWINCTELGFMKGYVNFFGGADLPIEQRLNRISEEYVLLKKLVAGDPVQRANLERVRAFTHQAVELTDRFRPVASRGQAASQKMRLLMDNLDLLSQIRTLVDHIADEIKLFGDPEFLQSTTAIAEVEKNTALVDRAVLAALAASTLVALLLFAYFIRSINNGVRLIVENTDRFREGVELVPPPRTGDELSEVGAAFYEMAQEIREAQRTKQAIVSMISHDLRSPLTSVLGYLSNLTSGVFGEASQETMDGARACERDIERLIRLITDLLDLDKIEAGKLELRPRMLAVNQVLEQAISSVTPLAQESGIAIEGAESSVGVYADPDRIAQALANVLSTAVRLSAPGSCVSTSVGTHDGEAEITVRTTGARLPQGELDWLFDRYRPSESGLRLELPISKEIVRLHGGEIGACADLPDGLRFWLRLPSP
jgi:signal transduction histidine kinase